MGCHEPNNELPRRKRMGSSFEACLIENWELCRQTEQATELQAPWAIREIWGGHFIFINHPN